MKELLGEFDLYNRESKVYEKAGVYKELDQKNFDDFEQLWKPMLDKRRSEVRSLTEAGDANIQDVHWDWVAELVEI